MQIAAFWGVVFLAALTLCDIYQHLDSNQMNFEMEEAQSGFQRTLFNLCNVSYEKKTIEVSMIIDYALEFYMRSS